MIVKVVEVLKQPAPSDWVAVCFHSTGISEQFGTPGAAQEPKLSCAVAPEAGGRGTQFDPVCTLQPRQKGTAQTCVLTVARIRTAHLLGTEIRVATCEALNTPVRALSADPGFLYFRRGQASTTCGERFWQRECSVRQRLLCFPRKGCSSRGRGALW